MYASTSTGKHWRKITRCLTKEEIPCPPHHGKAEQKGPLLLAPALPTHTPRLCSESQSTPRIPPKDSVLTLSPLTLQEFLLSYPSLWGTWCPRSPPR